MPRKHAPAVEPPERVRASIVVFQVNSLRAEIIRDLASHPEGSTTGDVGRRLNVDYRQVYGHIKTLDAAGILSSAESAPGTGRHIIYTLVPEALKALNKDFLNYLLGK